MFDYYENADTKVVVSPIGKSSWETSEGMAHFSKSGKTCYVFPDDTTMDVYRKKDKHWHCFGVKNQKWKIKII